jgi:hypothetical protein
MRDPTNSTPAGAAPKLRIYCETLPYDDVVRPRTVALLRRYRLELVLAVRPWQVLELPRVARTLAEAGVPVSVWPMLADEQGRWANADNTPSFARLLRDAIGRLVEAGSAPGEVLLDLEPSFAHARALAVSAGSAGEGALSRARALLGLGGTRPGPASARAMDAASNELGRSITELHDRGIGTASAIWPLVALDMPGERGWQSLLGTPVDALGTGRISVMVYTSILEGWSRGAVRRRDATALLSAASRRVTRRWGERAGVSLGCVGTGALVDEPVYRGPAELAVDVALARAAGVSDLSLFDLGGVLGREPAEAWLDAFAYGNELVEGEGLRRWGRPSRRVEVARRVARVATWALRLTR